MLNSANKIAENLTHSDDAMTDDALEAQIAKGQMTLVNLKQCFEKNNQFPAMGNSISQIMQVSNENGGNRKLSDIILQDQSLTSKILSIVNSSYYNQFGGEINTISRAVIILGIDQIQSISLSIMVIEKLNKGPLAETLKSYACQSFLSAFFAKKLVEDIKAINTEEAFLSSMFHNLGRQAILYFLPENYTEIIETAAKKNIDDDSASIDILGLNFSEIGQYIALQLQLPKNIILGIQSKPKLITERPSNAQSYLIQVSSLTNEILETAACGDTALAEIRLNEIITRYELSFALDYQRVLNMLCVLQQILLNYCGVIGINTNTNTFCINFNAFVSSYLEKQQETEI